MYRRNRRMARLLALAAVLALGAAACGSDSDDEAQTTTTVEQVQGSDMVTIDMTDFAYNVSGPLTAGGMLKISNSGKEFHMIALGKLQPGKTIDQLRDALMQAMDQQGGGGQGASTTTTAADGNILAQVTTTTAAGRSGATTTTAAGGRSGATTTTAAGGRSGATTTTAGGEEEGDPMEALFSQFFEGEIGYPGSFMGPGESVEISVPNLTPGTYGLICFIPTEGEGTPHFHKGMINQLEVVAGATPAQPNADATYQLTAGQPITGPNTLTPGRHTLKFDAAPGSQDVAPALVKLDAGTTVSEFDTEVEKFFASFEGETPPPKGAADTLPGQFVWAGSSLGGVTSFTLATDFTAGTYVIVAEPEEDGPTDTEGPPKEIIQIKVG